MTPERITEIRDGLKRWRHEDEDGPLVRELLDAVEQAHAAGQREGERKGIERAAKEVHDVTISEVAANRIKRRIRNLEVGEE